MNIGRNQIAALEKRYRTTFINSLPGCKCLQLAGTVNNAGVTNLALFNSVFHVGANPPLLGMIVRPQTPDHDTLKNIEATGQFTLNNVLPAWYRQAHQTSASYASGISEFAPCGFQEFYTEGFKAPFVQQATIKIGLEKRQVIPLEINGTTIIIGEIVQVMADDNVVAEDGYVDIVKAGSVTVAGLDSYLMPQLLGRLTYAKPDKQPDFLTSYPVH